MLLIRETVKPAGGAGPLRATVPVEPVPPGTELGLKVTEVIVGGFTVSVPLAVPFRVAVTITGVATATPTVIAVKVAVVAP
jgi:hypothetical protein